LKAAPQAGDQSQLDRPLEVARLASEREPLSAGGPATYPGESPLHRALTIVGRRWKLIASVVLAVGVLTVGIGLFQKRVYTCASSFMPQTGNPQGSALSGVAAQFGLALPLTDPTNSPQFYVDLARSREVLASLVDTPVVTKSGLRTVTWRVDDTYEVKGKTPALRRDAAIRALGSAVRAIPNTKTGVVSLAVTGPDPQFACGVNDRLLGALNTFNLTKRQSRVASERLFVEGRLANEQRDLTVAESNAQEFLRRNRDIRSSPQLVTAYDRLTSSLSLHRQLYNSLSQSLEQLKIEELRNTPVITIVENPEIPVRPDPRGLARRGIMMMIAVGILMVFAVFAQASFPSRGDFSLRKRA